MNFRTKENLNQRGFLWITFLEEVKDVRGSFVHGILFGTQAQATGLLTTDYQRITRKKAEVDGVRSHFRSIRLHGANYELYGTSKLPHDSHVVT